MAEPSKRTRTAALVLGLLVVVLLAYVDAQLAVPRIITASIVLGPLIAALACSSRQVTVVAAAAVAAAMLSPLWVTDPFSFEHLVQQLTVILGSGLAILAAMSRERHAVATKRLNLIAAIAGGDRAETFEQSAQRIVGRLVPEAADLATIDVAREAGPTRLAVRIDHPDAARLEAAFVERSKRGPGPGGITALSWEEPSLVTITDEMRKRAAFDAGDLEVLRAIDAHSYVIAPMRSRGKVIGALGLAYTSQSGRVYGPEDLAFAQSLADRIALALDNAGLSAEVSAVERRFRSALDVMGAAVLLQEPGRGIVYANDEAAQAFGLPDAEGVVRSSPEEIALSWLTVDEDGEPLTADRYPTRRILNEIELHPAPLITHAIHRETGRELWLSVTATPVFADDGTLQMAVSVSEDITRIKRAEKIKGVLARTGDVLASSLDPDQALQELAQVAVPDLADWCSVSLPGEDGVIHNVALAHRDPGKVAFAREYSRRFPARTSDPAGAAGILRGEPGLLIEVTDELLEASITDPEQLEMLRGDRHALGDPRPDQHPFGRADRRPQPRDGGIAQALRRGRPRARHRARPPSRSGDRERTAVRAPGGDRRSAPAQPDAGGDPEDPGLRGPRHVPARGP